MNIMGTIMLSVLSVCIVLLGVAIVIEIIDTVKRWKK